jgi:FkbM family methyltransferase
VVRTYFREKRRLDPLEDAPEQMSKLRRQIKKGLASLGYQVEGTRYCPRQLLEPALLRRLEFDDVVCRRIVEVGPEFTFIQVGAFDGITRDPLRKYIQACGWRGILLEPQPRPAAELHKLYGGNDRLMILQAALDGKRGTRALFTVESDSVPAWARGMASFQRDNIVKNAHLIPGLEAMIKEVTINCITFDDVMQKLSSDRLDLLQIDAEGADGYILSLFPFDRIQPAIIHWESKNLTKLQQEDALDLLRRQGYRFARSGGEDMLAVCD